MEKRGFSPRLAFDRDDPEFCHGFEMGAFWSQLQESPHKLVDGYLRPSNVEMAMRTGEATRRKVDSIDLSEHWIWVRFHPAGSLDDASLVSDEPFPDFSTGY